MYLEIEKDIFSVFGSISWKVENIKTYPSNFIAVNQGNEFIRVSTLVNSTSFQTIKNGILIIEIFTETGKGPRRVSEIADILDKYFPGKSFTTETGGTLQCFSSSLNKGSKDGDNPSLWKTQYSLTFKYYGVN